MEIDSVFGLNTLMALNDLLSISIRLMENGNIILAETIIREFNNYSWNIDLRNETDFDKDTFIKLTARFRELESNFKHIRIENFRSNVDSLAAAIGGIPIVESKFS